MQRRSIASRCLAVYGGAVLVSLFVVPLSGQIINFPTVTLDGLQEVPMNASPATGTGTVAFDAGTNQMSWTLSFSGLLGPQLAAHFHTGAPGVNGGVTINIGVGSPITGSAILTAPQISSLFAGNLYMNVHSSVFSAGEIRGQVLPPPASATSVGAGCQGLTLNANGLPSIPNPAFGLTISGATPGAPTFLFGAFGIASPAVPLGGGCFVHLDLTTAFLLINLGISPLGPVNADGAGNALYPLPIGPGLGGAGATVDLQGVVVTGGSVGTTNAMTITLGF